MRIIIAWLKGTVVTLALAGQAMAGSIPCSKRPYGEPLLTPDAMGPVHLTTARKATVVRTEQDNRPVPQLSPDGTAYFMARRSLGLQFGPEPAGSPPPVVSLPDVVEVGYGGGLPMPFAWQTDSRAMFGATQRHTRPAGGWALDGWRSVRIWRDGRVERLPKISHPSGELESLQWAGGRGLALAQFGTRGGLYKPARRNPRPAFAFVDAAHGRVLSTIPFETIPGVTPRRDGSDYALFQGPSAVIVRADGKLRAVVRTARGALVILDQDRPPRLAPIAGQPPPVGGLALSADGRRLLVTPSLQPSGMICEHNPNCPRPTAVEGPLATFYDLSTGQRLWELRATATDFWGPPLPALSPDGALALVGLPRDAGDPWPRVALVSTLKGKVVETLCGPDSSSNVLSFLPDGRMALSGAGQFAVYRLDSSAFRH